MVQDFPTSKTTHVTVTRDKWCQHIILYQVEVYLGGVIGLQTFIPLHVWLLTTTSLLQWFLVRDILLNEVEHFLSHVYSQILLSDSSPIGNALSFIFQEDREHEIWLSPSFINFDNMTFLVNFPNKYLPSDSNWYNRKRKTKCVHCGILGYIKDRCYKLVGYPLKYSFKKNKFML